MPRNSYSPPQRRPDRPGSPLAFNINVRLTQEQYGVLVLVAEQHDVTIAAAVRHVIERWALGFTDDQGRTLLDAARTAAPDPKLAKWAQQLALQTVQDD